MSTRLRAAILLTIFSMCYLPPVEAKRAYSTKGLSAEEQADEEGPSAVGAGKPAGFVCNWQLLSKAEQDEEFTKSVIARADESSVKHIFLLACMYFHGKGVALDHKKSLELLTLAANKGHSNAQNNLGYLFENGIATATLPSKAHAWYATAARYANSNAECNLGHLYEYGIGVPKDLVRAVKWYQMAASHGNRVAKRNLYRYDFGRRTTGLAFSESEMITAEKLNEILNTGGIENVLAYEEPEQKQPVEGEDDSAQSSEDTVALAGDEVSDGEHDAGVKSTTAKNSTVSVPVGKPEQKTESIKLASNSTAPNTETTSVNTLDKNTTSTPVTTIAEKSETSEASAQASNESDKPDLVAGSDKLTAILNRLSEGTSFGESYQVTAKEESTPTQVKTAEKVDSSERQVASKPEATAPSPEIEDKQKQSKKEKTRESKSEKVAEAKRKHDRKRSSKSEPKKEIANVVKDAAKTTAAKKEETATITTVAEAKPEAVKEAVAPISSEKTASTEAVKPEEKIAIAEKAPPVPNTKSAEKQSATVSSNNKAEATEREISSAPTETTKPKTETVVEAKKPSIVQVPSTELAHEDVSVAKKPISVANVEAEKPASPVEKAKPVKISTEKPEPAKQSVPSPAKPTVVAAANANPVTVKNQVADAVKQKPYRDKWALVVGISYFENSDIPRLRYASKDATDFYKYLVEEANFRPDHVRLLLDEKATQRRVLSELGSKFLARVVKPDDLVVLYFSTHGSPAQLDARGSNYLVSFDSDPSDLFVSGIEMQKLLDSIQGRVLTDRVLLVLDACHSGFAGKHSKGITRGANFNAAELAQGSGQMVICSSKPDERSWESIRYENGVFTKNLLESLRKDEKQPLVSAFKQASEVVASEVKEDRPGARQTPILSGKWDGKDLILSVPAAAPQDIPQSVAENLSPDSKIDLNNRPLIAMSSAGQSKSAVDEFGGDNSATTYLNAEYFKINGDPKRLIKECNGAINANPTDPELYFMRAKAHIQLGDWFSALNDLKDSIQIRPNEGQYYLARAYVYFRMGKAVMSNQDIMHAKFFDKRLAGKIKLSI